MKKLTTTVTYRVPNGIYCNHTMAKSTPKTRCRFCTDVGKDGFVCVLHNDPLSVIDGKMVMKCEGCLCSSAKVEDTQLPVVPPQDLMTYAMTEYHKIYAGLRAQGIPDALAHKNALAEVLK